ncbi:ATP-dependent DNA ligase [Candidatus Woesearchaeota archaeon]|nr:ATP-dependent DNA ligase [Candidatus Woesearchaeota archaeon]
MMKYSDLVKIYEQLESTTKRLEKINCLSDFLRNLDKKELEKIILLVQGKIFPDWNETKIGVSSQLVIKALKVATGKREKDIINEWKNTGDLGEAAASLVNKKSQFTLISKDLTVDKVFTNLRKLPTLEGMGSVDSKIKLIAELLSYSKLNETKYIIRTILEELRVGLGEGTVRDSIGWAFFNIAEYNKKENKVEMKKDREYYNHVLDTIQEAYDMSNDFSVVIKKAKEGLDSLKKVDLSVGTPIKVMLAQKVDSIKEGFSRVEKPAALEYKYDGFRMQIHKNKEGAIMIFTRRLENVTNQFPEVVGYVKEHIKEKNFVIDSEAVGYDPSTKKYLPFQNISKRIKRKYNIEKMSKKYPVELNIFDVLYLNGKNLIKRPFKERRKILDKILKNPEKYIIKAAEQIITDSEKKSKEFYENAVDRGMEGIMMKNLTSHYKPGKRVGHMVKLKSSKDPLDFVITGAEWGTGKRGKWLSSFLVSVLDKEKNEYLEIGKVGTGIKELEEQGLTFRKLTSLLNPLIIEEKGKTVKVKPEIVISVVYEEIQKSPSYSSGFALRFPRVISLREDKDPSEVHTLGEINKLYEEQ